MKNFIQGALKKKWVKIVVLLLLALLIVFLIRASVYLQSLVIEWLIVLAVFGGLYYAAKKLVDRFRYRNIQTKIDQAKYIQLTAREKQILVRIADGYTNKEIGEQIFISESAVKKHITTLFEKLNAKRRTEAVRIARDARLIT